MERAIIVSNWMCFTRDVHAFLSYRDMSEFIVYTRGNVCVGGGGVGERDREIEKE